MWSHPSTWPVNSTNWPEHLPQHTPGSIILYPEHLHSSDVDIATPMQFRIAFYTISADIMRLVEDVDEMWEWLDNMGHDGYQTMTLMRFVEHFNISREEFDTVVDRMREGLEDMAARGRININSELFELPNADIIFTFDNDIVRYFYRRE